MAAIWAGSADKTTFRIRPDSSEQIDQLIENIQRLKLMNQAMWELLSERALLTDKASRWTCATANRTVACPRPSCAVLPLLQPGLLQQALALPLPQSGLRKARHG